MEYKYNEIEKKWQDAWKKNQTYKVSNNSDKPKYYVLDMFPYPSGAGLHVGHPLGYIASDIYSRYKRLKGFNVLHPMGFDSFGLPAEQYAIETGQHPAATTKNNIATFKAQLDKIGFCYDWDREVRTSDPQYYKWTQWIFLQLFNSYFCNTQKKALPISGLINKYATTGALPKKGKSVTGIHFTAHEWKGYSKKEQEDILMKHRLAFCAYGVVNWCEALGTVLANDEVVNGVSERGGHPVEKKKMRQWYLRITAYADRLLEGLEKVDFSESMKEMQRNWIGKSQGAEMDFAIKESEQVLKVYTTRPDTIFGVDFMVVAPEMDLVRQIKSTEQATAVDEYIAYVKSRSDVDRMAEKKITGCFTGAYAINPFSGQQIPIYISEYVLAGYGTGAIMAVPCGDERDFKFAQHFNIPISNIIGKYFNGEEANATKEAALENSGFLNGMKMMDASELVLKKLEEQGIGKRKVNYRMRDAGFSRQRYWGEPFPIIWSDGVAIPLDADELPLQLPHVEKYGPGPDGEGPLANITDWVNVSAGTKHDLTPSLAPKERGVVDHSVVDSAPDLQAQNAEKETAAKDSPGYFNSSVEEWKNTLSFAKINRKNLTEAEEIIWQELRNRNIGGFKFRRQHPIAGYIPDFVCLDKKLIIEIDGEYHDEGEQKKLDMARQYWLAENGFEMLRFTNGAVKTNVEEVLKEILQELQKEKTEVSKATGSQQEEKGQQPAGANSPLPWRGVGGEVRRETSTMPGYAGSSWYFLRYMDPHNTETFCDRKASDYWNQVDLYIGGTEHAVGHLLYSRLWTKVLFDLGYIGYEEPFKKLLNQGMIQGSSRFVYRIGFSIYSGPGIVSTPVIFVSKGISDKIKLGDESVINEIKVFSKKLLEESYGDNKGIDINGVSIIEYHVDVKYVDGFELDVNEFKKWRDEYNNAYFFLEDGKYLCGAEIEKMSKSKYNTVSPDELCEKYGADTFRMYEMFLGPVEASKPWDTKGIEGVHRFLKKLWRLFFDEVKGKVWTDEKATDAELKVLHKTIKKIEEDTERFSFNTAVSTFMICVNELADLKCHKKEILEPLLILLTPYAPHIAEELWHSLGSNGSVLDAHYPIFNPALLVESSKEYPISINGKVRANINLALNLNQAEVEKMVLENEIVQKWLDGKDPKKIIYVKNKMVNVVI